MQQEHELLREVLDEPVPGVAAAKPVGAPPHVVSTERGDAPPPASQAPVAPGTWYRYRANVPGAQSTSMLRAQLRRSRQGALGFNTLAVRVGHERTAEGEHSEPVFETSSYVYADSAESEAAFAGTNGKHVYSRFTNPTVNVFEKRIAALERTEGAVATGSGMATLFATFMTFLRSGDHLICSRSVFGSTIVLLRDYLAKFGVLIDFVPLCDPAAWQRAVRPETRMLFCETPSNPLLEVADLHALASTARSAGALLVVDNTFCTPSGQNPIAFGADIVIHSAGKYIDGQGRCVGGVAAGPQNLMTSLRAFMRCAGPTLSAHNAWIFLKGLETLQLRMQRHSDSAQIVAEWLTRHPRVAMVRYTGLSSHPQHQLARSQQRCHGGVLSFTIHGSQSDAWRCIDAMQMISRTTNIGDTKTTVTHPATTTHLKIPKQDKDAAGITGNLIRLTIGLEDVDDIITDLERGISAI